MALTKGSKWDAAEAILKLIIKDPALYCYNCGEKFRKELYPCCPDPLVDTWRNHLAILKDEIKEANKMNANKFGSIKGKAMRSCITLPPVLLHMWSKIFESQYGEKLMRTQDAKLYKQDVRNIMRRFPMFRRCEVV